MPGRVHPAWWALAAGWWIAAAGPLAAKTFLTVDEALMAAYPGAKVARTTVFLDRDQQRRVRDIAGTKLTSAIVHPYEVRVGGDLVAVVFFDAHRVRTLPQTLMVALDPSGEVEAVKVLAFTEPEDYLAPGRWYERFAGRRFDDELQVGRGIDGITGATLTARATTESVRRMAALLRELYPAAP